MLGALRRRAAHNGLELSCPAEAGNSSPLYATPAGRARHNEGPARRVSFSELLGRTKVRSPLLEFVVSAHDGARSDPGSPRSRQLGATP